MQGVKRRPSLLSLIVLSLGGFITLILMRIIPCLPDPLVVSTTSIQYYLCASSFMMNIPRNGMVGNGEYISHGIDGPSRPARERLDYKSAASVDSIQQALDSYFEGEGFIKLPASEHSNSHWYKLNRDSVSCEIKTDSNQAAIVTIELTYDWMP